MENNLVRTEELLGSKKNVIGSANADIILETLGKVYIKTGKQTKVLNDVFKLLDGINNNNAGSKTVITRNLASLKYPGDGYLVFDSKENALYISYDQRYLLIIDGIDKEIKDLGFVKKEGDSMYGPLQIHHNGAPLIVGSSELVKRFNANFLEGHDSTYFAAKSLDEFISGYWTFEHDTKFNENIVVDKNVNVGQDSLVGGNSVVSLDLTVKGSAEVYDVAQFRNNVKVEGDIVLEGSIGSQMFMSGYLGYGWKFDSLTNMLTVDYLVVRKAMHVFELVVNKISATNGSLWVTDSAKIEEVYDVKTLPLNTVTDEDGVSYTKYSLVELNVWYVPYDIDYNRVKLTINDINIKRPELYTSINGNINLIDNYYDIFKYICKYKPLYDWINEDPGDKNNMDKIATLFPESDCGIGELTHFLRDAGFGFPLDGEIPIYTHDANQSFREPIIYNYCDDKGNSLPDNYNEEYAYIRLTMCVEADAEDLSNIGDLYRYNSVTKKYIKYNSDVLEYERYKYKYIQKTCSVKVLYSSKLTPLEKATHFKYIKDNKEYFIEAKPTHIQNTSQRYTWDIELLEYIINDYGEFYFDGTDYVEFKDFIEAEPATHYYDRNSEEYKESTYYDENSETYIYSGIKPEYYFNSITNSWEKGASHIYNDATDEYVLVEEPTHLLSNFRLAEGLPGATHVFVPESYFAVASNVYVPTHKRYEKITEDDPEFITREELSVIDPQISTNRILNSATTPKIIVVDKQLKKLVTPSDIKCLDAFYKYFGLVANDDIWDGTSIVKLDNVKVIKMKEDEYPPFKEGDILRCLKFENGDIKFYEAIVACKIDTYSYIIIIAGSVFDIQTTVEYNDDGTVKEYKEELNKSQYSKTSQLESNYGESAIDKDGFNENSLIAGPAPEDGLVKIGHLFDRDRLNSVYITSSEMNSPYIQTISGVNRPDYTVLYGEPDFITNDRGYYQFSVEHFNIIDGNADEGVVSVNTPNGIDKFVCRESKFFAPNNHYINSNNTVVLADYNIDKVRVNNNSRVRLGNLNGITDPMFGNKQPYGYGLFADNVFLKGEFYLNNGNSVVEFTKEQINMQFSKALDMQLTVFPNNGSYGTSNKDWSNPSGNGALQRGSGYLLFVNDSNTTSTIQRKSSEKFTNWKDIKISLNIAEFTGSDINIELYSDASEDAITTFKIDSYGLNKQFTYQFTEEDVEKHNGRYVYLVIKLNNSYVAFNGDCGEVTLPYKDVISQLKIDSDGLAASVENKITGLSTTLNLTDQKFSTAVQGLEGRVSSIEQTSDNIAMSVGKIYLFTPTILESQLKDCILLWNGETKSITTLEDGTKTAYIHNTNNLAGFYKKSSNKVTLKKDNTLLFEVNVYNTGICFVLLNSYNQVISDAVYYDESNKFVSCTATATGSGNNISFNFKTAEATSFPGYFTIKLDISDDYVYLYCVSSTNSIYFYNDRVLLDLGSVFNMTKDAISMDLESAGIYLGDGHPDPKYNGANIVLTGANTYIDSDITINSNSMDITDVDGNNLKINKELTNFDSGIDKPISDTLLTQTFEYDSNSYLYLWTTNSNSRMSFGWLRNREIINDIGESDDAVVFGTLPMIHNTALQSVKFNNGYEYDASELVLYRNLYGEKSNYNWYIIKDNHGDECYLANYVYVWYEDPSTPGTSIETYMHYADWKSYGGVTGSIFGKPLYIKTKYNCPVMYAKIDGNYLEANSFVYYFKKGAADNNSYAPDPYYDVPIINNSGRYTIYSDEEIKGGRYGNIVAVYYGTYGDTPASDSATTPKEYILDSGPTTADTFKVLSRAFVLFFKFPNMSNLTLTAKNPSCSGSNSNAQITHHMWLTTEPYNIDLVPIVNAKNLWTPVSITVSNKTNCYYCVIFLGSEIDYDGDTFIISATFSKTLIESSSKSYITPYGFHFTSPNQKNFINFGNSAFEVGSTSKWVRFSEDGIDMCQALFKVGSIKNNVFCEVTTGTTVTNIHKFT